MHFIPETKIIDFRLHFTHITRSLDSSANIISVIFKYYIEYYPCTVRRLKEKETRKDKNKRIDMRVINEC